MERRVGRTYNKRTMGSHLVSLLYNLTSSPTLITFLVPAFCPLRAFLRQCKYYSYIRGPANRNRIAMSEHTYIPAQSHPIPPETIVRCLQSDLHLLMVLVLQSAAPGRLLLSAGHGMSADWVGVRRSGMWEKYTLLRTSDISFACSSPTLFLRSAPIRWQKRHQQTNISMIIFPNPYHNPPAPTNPDNLTLFASAFNAFRTFELNGGGMVKSAQSLLPFSDKLFLKI
jgi:hypothetical protein